MCQDLSSQICQDLDFFLSGGIFFLTFLNFPVKYAKTFPVKCVKTFSVKYAKIFPVIYAKTFDFILGGVIFFLTFLNFINSQMCPDLKVRRAKTFLVKVPRPF